MSERKRIFLIEDNEADASIIREALAEGEAVCDVVHFRDGEEALAALMNEGLSAPDAILLDLNMPKSDGLDVLRLIRKTPRLARVPVGVLTGSSATHDRQRASMSGAACYIEKPISYDEFIETVRHAVHDMLPPESADGREDVGGEEKQ